MQHKISAILFMYMAVKKRDYIELFMLHDGLNISAWILYVFVDRAVTLGAQGQNSNIPLLT